MYLSGWTIFFLVLGVIWLLGAAAQDGATAERRRCNERTVERDLGWHDLYGYEPPEETPEQARRRANRATRQDKLQSAAEPEAVQRVLDRYVERSQPEQVQ